MSASEGITHSPCECPADIAVEVRDRLLGKFPHWTVVTTNYFCIRLRDVTTVQTGICYQDAFNEEPGSLPRIDSYAGDIERMVNNGMSPRNQRLDAKRDPFRVHLACERSIKSGEASRVTTYVFARIEPL